MKTTIVILSMLFLSGLFNSFSTSLSPGKITDPEDHVIVSYTLNRSEILISYGGTRSETVKEDKSAGIHNSVINIFNELSVQGYSLVSTTTVGIPGKTSPDILVYFEKRK